MCRSVMSVTERYSHKRREAVMESKSIIKVHLHKPYNGKTDYFFTTLSKIYRLLNAEVVGISYGGLTNVKILSTKFYANRCCTISVEPLNPTK